MPLCKVFKCKFSESHVTYGHQCGSCKKFGHGQYECRHINKINALKYHNDMLPQYLECKRPYCQHKNKHLTNCHKCNICFGFHSEYNCKLSIEFAERKKIELSIINPKLTVECPTCKQKCTIFINQNKVYGLDNKCIICMDNIVNVFLPCGHVNICLECTKKISLNNDPVIQNHVLQNHTDYNGLQIDELKSDTTYDEFQQYFTKKYAGIDGLIYTNVYIGNNSYVYIKRNTIGELVEIYIYDYNDIGTPIIGESIIIFIEGYKLV